MKCYTFLRGKLERGIEVVHDDDTEREIIILGETGRGHRHRETIGLTHKKPARVIDGRVFDAKPVHIVIDRGKHLEQRSFFVLRRPSGSADKRALVRIRSCIGDAPDCSGSWKPAHGFPVTLVHAFGAHGSGVLGFWDDDLVVLAPGDAIAVHDSGSGCWLLEYDQIHHELRVMPYETQSDQTFHVA